MKGIFYSLLILMLTSCYTTQIIVGEGAQGNDTINLKQTHLINGLFSFDIAIDAGANDWPSLESQIDYCSWTTGMSDIWSAPLQAQTNNSGRRLAEGLENLGQNPKKYKL